MVSVALINEDASALVELKAAFELQSKAFLKDQSPSLAVRLERINKIPGMLMSRRVEIQKALTADFGCHPIGSSDVIETLGPAGRAAFVASQLEGWMKDDQRAVDPALYGNATAYVHYEAKGVVGNLLPFNFPFDLSVGPLVEMLAAGNRVIMKPSEFTPACGKLLKEMINATYEKDLVEVVLGGTDLAMNFSATPWNHLLYTGSPAVGKLVMAAASKNLTPVTLELGGKCPAMVAPGACNEKTVEAILGTKGLKNGQMCVTVDYVLVHSSELDSFVSLLKKRFSDTLGDYSKGPDCCGIITDRHLERLQGLLKEARDSGAKVIDLESATAPEGRRMPLTLVLDPKKDLKIMTEEIFGPILPIIPYDTLESAVDEVNAGERPLGLYIFSDVEKEVAFVVNNTRSGGLSVNACAIQAALPSLGFGGSGNSGMGRHHGLEGFREFSNPRGIFRRGTDPDLLAALYPPYATASAVADHAFKAAGL